MPPGDQSFSSFLKCLLFDNIRGSVSQIQVLPSEIPLNTPRWELNPYLLNAYSSDFLVPWIRTARGQKPDLSTRCSAWFIHGMVHGTTASQTYGMVQGLGVADSTSSVRGKGKNQQAFPTVVQMAHNSAFELFTSEDNNPVFVQVLSLHRILTRHTPPLPQP